MIMHVILRILIYSFSVLNFVLPACTRNFAEVSRAS